jgi:hypothetical protein
MGAGHGNDLVLLDDPEHSNGAYGSGTAAAAHD